jgi:HEAT repeat protein
MTYYDVKKGIEQLAQAHVPVAIATLVGRNLDPKGTLKKRFLKDLEDRKKADWIRQSCAMALGQMAKPDEPEYSKALQDYYKSGNDQQARYFSLMSLGQIGGEKNRAFLLEKVAEARKIDQAWAAVALGVLSFDLRAKDPNADVDRTAGDTVQRQLKLNKNREVQAGLCVALGLLKYNDAAEDIMQLLQEKSSDDELAGYACLGLGLMNHKAAIGQIKALAEDSVRRQGRLKQAAIALGLLGDKTVVETLVKFLKDKGTSLASQAAIATALGYIGDARSLDPLVEMLHDKDLTPLARAFAGVALGIVADKEEFPWNSKISTNLNYRANTETLTNQFSGVLDIL